MKEAQIQPGNKVSAASSDHFEKINQILRSINLKLLYSCYEEMGN